jgi:hypothetical protein
VVENAEIARLVSRARNTERSHRLLGGRHFENFFRDFKPALSRFFRERGA